MSRFILVAAPEFESGRLYRHSLLRRMCLPVPPCGQKDNYTPKSKYVKKKDWRDKVFRHHCETTRYCKKGLRGWILTSNNTFRLQFLTLCSSYLQVSLKFYHLQRRLRPLSEIKISLMLRQRQHTVSTSAYSTIIEIPQLLQTKVTIGS